MKKYKLDSVVFPHCFSSYAEQAMMTRIVIFYLQDSMIEESSSEWDVDQTPSCCGLDAELLWIRRRAADVDQTPSGCGTDSDTDVEEERMLSCALLQMVISYQVRDEELLSLRLPDDERNQSQPPSYRLTVSVCELYVV